MIVVESLYSKGAVLQQGTCHRIHGKATPKAELILCFRGKSYKSKSDQEGIWTIVLDEQSPGGPFDIVIEAQKDQLRIEDIYVGQVFILAGQSNMELPLKRIYSLYKEEIDVELALASEKRPCIRQFLMPKEAFFSSPSAMMEEGQWMDMSQLDQISGLGYFFAKDYYENRQIPIGLIQAAVGGSPIDAWCSETLLRRYYNEEKMAGIQEKLETLKKKKERDKQKQEEMRQQIAWYKRVKAQEIESINKGPIEKGILHIPGAYKQVTSLNDFSGLVCLHKTIDISDMELKRIEGQDLYLDFGTLVDHDLIFVNGEKIGETTYRYPPRHYRLPKGLLHVGSNHIYIRQFIKSGQGEATVTKGYHLRSQDKTLAISLRGEWAYEIMAKTNKCPSETFFTWQATALYHSMIERLAQRTFAGVLWYQGESDTPNPKFYGEKLMAMVDMFREKLKDPRLIFIEVQLAAFGNPIDSLAPGGWSAIRKEQLKLRKIPYTAMVTATDLGEKQDIHPLRKKVLGQRLAQAALELENHRELYKTKGYIQGPCLQKIQWIEDEIHLIFESVSRLDIRHPFVMSIVWRERTKTSEEVVSTSLVFQRMTQKSIICKLEYGQLKAGQRIKIVYGQGDYPKPLSIYDEKGYPLVPFVENFSLEHRQMMEGQGYVYERSI